MLKNELEIKYKELEKVIIESDEREMSLKRTMGRILALREKGGMYNSNEVSYRTPNFYEIFFEVGKLVNAKNDSELLKQNGYYESENNNLRSELKELEKTNDLSTNKQNKE